MFKIKKICFVVLLLLFTNTAAFASQVEGEGELKGNIESINQSEHTFVVQGITFHTSDQTKYNDGFRSFDDLAEDQRVEVEFVYREGRHFATEVERDRVTMRGMFR